ncbi:unnamed protein product [Calicophoron daubneyi]|uniref:Mitochondrial inner membrane protein Mpv17 n=1 Tax=Calicophoron daubneyi TaxID=300641 RepID=A0AAV2TZR6_CALDB
MTDPPRREGVDQSALRRTLLVRWFRYKPLMKNIAISSLLLMFGEVAAQEIKNYMRLKGYSQPENGSMKKPECSDGTHSKKTENQFDLNLRMVGRQGLIGAFEGTYQHIYYTWLDRKLIGTSALVVAKKVALDEVAVGPMSLFVFLMFITRNVFGFLICAVVLMGIPM